MDAHRSILPIFAIGLVLIALYAMYQNQGTLAATAVGAIAGVFALPRNYPKEEQPKGEEQ